MQQNGGGRALNKRRYVRLPCDVTHGTSPAKLVSVAVNAGWLLVAKLLSRGERHRCVHGLCNLGLFARDLRLFYLERVCETLVTTFAARLAAGPDISSESSLARFGGRAKQCCFVALPWLKSWKTKTVYKAASWIRQSSSRPSLWEVWFVCVYAHVCVCVWGGGGDVIN